MEFSIPCCQMRGGTSKGLYFRRSDLPSTPRERDRVLLAAMGSPNSRQIDGLGGANPLTSKVAIVSPSRREGVDVDYLFGQVSVDSPCVDYSFPCGNLLCGIGPFAIESGLVSAQEGVTTVRIFDVNSNSLVEATVQTPNRKVVYTGDASIDGVPGTAAPVDLTYSRIVGGKTGKLLPTGNAVDVIDGVLTTCVDIVGVLGIIQANSVSKSGYESKAELDGDGKFLDRIAQIRRKISETIGCEPSAPRIVLVSPPQFGGTFSSRFVGDDCHPAYPVSAAIGVCASRFVEGSMVGALTEDPASPTGSVVLEHPSGKISVLVALDANGRPERASVTRTARLLMKGSVFVSV